MHGPFELGSVGLYRFLQPKRLHTTRPSCFAGSAAVAAAAGGGAAAGAGAGAGFFV